MFVKLIEHYNHYMNAMEAEPYDPAAVQGHGMVFNASWREEAVNVMAFMGIKEADVDYNKFRFVMPKLIEKIHAKTE